MFILQLPESSDCSLLSVWETAKALYPNDTFDTSLPQSWVNHMMETGFDPYGHFVWAYSDSLAGHPLPITKEGFIHLCKVMAHFRG